MTRSRLPDRRHCLTVRVPVTLDGGKEQVVLATIGFADVEMTDPREVFAADWKAGTAMQSVLMDGCVLLSRLLQHGDSPAEIAASLCQPPSVLGAVAAAVASHAEGKLVALPIASKRVCKKCERPILAFDSMVSSEGSLWHMDCHFGINKGQINRDYFSKNNSR